MAEAPRINLQAPEKIQAPFRMEPDSRRDIEWQVVHVFFSPKVLDQVGLAWTSLDGMDRAISLNKHS